MIELVKRSRELPSKLSWTNRNEVHHWETRGPLRSQSIISTVCPTFIHSLLEWQNYAAFVSKGQWNLVLLSISCSSSLAEDHVNIQGHTSSIEYYCCHDPEEDTPAYTRRLRNPLSPARLCAEAVRLCCTFLWYLADAHHRRKNQGVL